MRILKKFLIFIAAAIVLVWLITLIPPKAEKIEYGVTFSYPYAESLGLDWRQAYLAILDDLKPKYVRLSAYWDKVEAVRDQYDFQNDPENQSEMNFQVNEAGKRGIKIVLAVGRRLPRWPECHDPSWINNMDAGSVENAQLSYVEAVVRQYQDNPNIVAWQVENEPFLSSFGICPPLDQNFYDREIALVKKLDPVKPILITDSGELNWWIKASARGDIFGTTFYRYVYSDVLRRYWTNFYFYPWVYRFKSGIIRMLHPGKPIMISELEAEPWTTDGITSTPLDQQFQTMSLDHFGTITSLAAKTGISPQLLWGAEWWYWMKTAQNHPEFWEKAKNLINN
ncbi:MAG: cellulase family glycosylhydrolase [Patescibacteria group bacterium]|nr:cellulase family glycosylhydrolase [Patescibacteria group bacterium]